MTEVKKSFKKEKTSLEISMKLKEKLTKEKENEIYKTLESSFDAWKYYDEISLIIKWIRTIIRKQTEEELWVVTTWNRCKYEVLYQDQKLKYYHVTEQLEQETTFSLEYKDKHINIDTPLKGEEGTRATKNRLDKELGTIIGLQKQYANHLIEEDIELCACYQEMYNKTPDFTSEMIYPEIKAMLSLMATFNLSSHNLNYSPLSSNLKYQIFNLTPYGKINIEENILEERSKKILNTIGQELKSILEMSENPAIVLEQISEILHANNYDVVPLTEEELSKRTFYEKDIIEENLHRIRKIKEAMDAQ